LVGILLVALALELVEGDDDTSADDVTDCVIGALRVAFGKPVIVDFAVDVFDIVLVLVTVFVKRMLPVFIGDAVGVYELLIERDIEGEVEVVFVEVIVLDTLELELDVLETDTVEVVVWVFTVERDIPGLRVTLEDADDVLDPGIDFVNEGLAVFVLDIIFERLIHAVELEVLEELAEELEVLDAVELFEGAADREAVCVVCAVIVAGSVADAVFVLAAERVI